MKAIVKTEKTYGGIEVLELEKPTPKENEVLVNIKNASICGSDVHAYAFSASHNFITTPVIMGHECSGEIVELGKGVSEFKVGDRVVIEITKPCGKCNSCLKGKEHICNDLKVRGMHIDGFYTEYIAVEPKHLHKIPDTLSFEHASMIEPISVLTHAIIDKSEVRAGDLVLITGPGPIGLLAAQVIKSIGATPIVVGTEADEVSRLPVAKQLDLITLNVERYSITEFLKENFNKEVVTAVIECSGAVQVVQQAIELTEKGGSITLVGMFSKRVELDLSLAIRKEITIYTSYASNWLNFERSINLLDKGLINVDPLTTIYAIEDAAKAFEDALHKRVIKPIFRF
ncbi:zinc-binding dehydrogenase [Psychrobacillus sp. OK032]|uniref:zinc-dependent alcohol dehydrogenase n=1 Tax=Psychrobacillus sp. OK032 TaxID=1884358 RepID=UPI0008CAF6A2|nr:alcohol dehydrogenase catalytic domain-containing protein [Psychrobacillus sp. OK032]SER69880.1 L-iditol 2-dehydrogenase [Psychrobacillus sp. OK032]